MTMDGTQATQGGIHGKDEPQQEHDRGGREM